MVISFNLKMQSICLTTGCDGVAIGRGAMGNPWLFKRILNLMNGKEDFLPTVQDRIYLAIRQLDMTCDHKGIGLELER